MGLLAVPLCFWGDVPPIVIGKLFSCLVSGVKMLRVVTVCVLVGFKCMYVHV